MTLSTPQYILRSQLIDVPRSQPKRPSRRPIIDADSTSATIAAATTISRRQQRQRQSISLSKTREWGHAIDSEHLSELTEEDESGGGIGGGGGAFAPTKLGGFARLDRRFLTPFFTRRFTTQELHDCKSQMTDLTNKWYQAIRVSPDEAEPSDEDDNADDNDATLGGSGGGGDGDGDVEEARLTRGRRSRMVRNGGTLTAVATSASAAVASTSRSSSQSNLFARN